MAKLNESISKTNEALLKAVRGLGLNEEAQKSRITFSNANRVCALEVRKHYVLVHLPKRENLKELITTVPENGKDIDHIEPFRPLFDSRKWTYIRVSKPAEVRDALKVIEFAQAHNASA